LKRILITGAGNLGLALYDYFNDGKTNESVLVARHPIPSSRIKSFSGDITIPDSMTVVFRKVKPDAIIHTAALTDVDLCEKEQKKAYSVNVEGTRNLVRLCEINAIPMVYISTDYVFDGMKGDYRENDTPNPVNIYGKSKLDGEHIVRRMENGDWAVIRTSFLFNSFSTSYDFISYVFNGLKQNRKMKFDDYRLSKPTPCSCLGPPIERILSRGLRGVFHICGRDMLSPYKIARKCAVISEFDPNSIAVRERPGPGAQRPVNPTLNTEKAEKELGFTPPDLEDCLKAFFKQCTRNSLRSAKQRLY